MKRIVGLAAFCCIVLNVGIVLDVEAQISNQQRLELEELKKDENVQDYIKLRKDSKIQNYIKLRKKYLEKRKDQDVQDYVELKKDPKVKEYINLKRNSKIDSNSEDESNDSVSNNSRRKRKRKNEDRAIEGNSGYAVDNESSNTKQTSQKSKNRKRKRNRKNRSRNRSNRNDMTNQNNQMNQNQTDNEFVLNEPIINGSKLQKSSIIVEKDIKLASKDESKSVDKKISSIELSPLDKKEVLAQTDSTKNLKLAANFDNFKKEIKEKLLQVNNSRKNYHLIRTPDKKLKNNIQVSKFRDELDRYRKLYSANLKKA